MSKREYNHLLAELGERAANLRCAAQEDRRLQRGASQCRCQRGFESNSVNNDVGLGIDVKR